MKRRGQVIALTFKTERSEALIWTMKLYAVDNVCVWRKGL